MYLTCQPEAWWSHGRDARRCPPMRSWGPAATSSRRRRCCAPSSRHDCRTSPPGRRLSALATTALDEDGAVLPWSLRLRGWWDRALPMSAGTCAGHGRRTSRRVTDGTVAGLQGSGGSHAVRGRRRNGRARQHRRPACQGLMHCGDTGPHTSVFRQVRRRGPVVRAGQVAPRLRSGGATGPGRAAVWARKFGEPSTTFTLSP